MISLQLVLPLLLQDTYTVPTIFPVCFRNLVTLAAVLPHPKRVL